MAPSSIWNQKSPTNDLSPYEKAARAGYTGFAAQFEKDPAKFNGVLSEEAKLKANEFVESVLKQNINRPTVPPLERSSEFSTPTLTEFDTTQNGTSESKKEIIDQAWLDEQHDLFIRKPDADRRDVPLYKSEFFGDESDEFSRIPQPSAIPSFGTSTPVQQMISQPLTLEEHQAIQRNEIDALWESEDE